MKARATRILFRLLGIMTLGLFCLPFLGKQELGFDPLSPPRLFAPTTIDLGEQEIGDHVMGRFALRNQGGQDLIIDELRTSCGCSSVEYMKDGQLSRVTNVALGPGEKCDLFVRVGVQGDAGAPMTSHIFLRSNDPEKPTTMIRVVVPRVKGGVAVQPSAVIFGDVSVGEDVTRTFSIYDGGKTGRAIARVTCSRPDRFSIRQLPLPVDQSVDRQFGAMIGVVEVRAASERAGPLEGEIAIWLAGEERAPDSVAVLGMVKDLVEVYPATFIVPAQPGDNSMWRGRCFCQGPLGRPLLLTVESAPDGVHVSSQTSAASPSTHFLSIECDRERLGRSTPGAARVIRLRAASGEIQRVLTISLICPGNGGAG